MQDDDRSLYTGDSRESIVHAHLKIVLFYELWLSVNNRKKSEI